MSTTRDVAAIVAHLKANGSAERAAGIQWFFKEAIASHGWRTADLRRYAAALYRAWKEEPARLVAAADRLFASEVLEEKVLAVLMLQRSVRWYGAPEFVRFERWLGKVSSWADHDALAMFLLGPLMTAEPARAGRALVWARSRRHWHRRAAAVSLIDGVRRGLFSDEAGAVTLMLAADADDMVQKGVGWLLREWGKVRPAETVPLLMTLRGRTSRLVLRTACERLPAPARERVLARDRHRRAGAPGCG